MPNLVTVTGLCLGISALRYALDEKFIIATALILVAAIMDAIDGRIARLLKFESEFGAQLDSLADMISFGVAPAIIAYLWSLHNIPYLGVGWSVVLFFITCGALRLARFNSDLTNAEAAARSKLFFKGIPIPAAACLSLMPMITTFEIVHTQYSPWFIACYMVLLGLLMVSRVPTYAAKQFVIAERYIMFIQILSCLIVMAIILEPWRTLPLIGVIYFLMIPCSIVQYHKRYSKKLASTRQ